MPLGFSFSPGADDLAMRQGNNGAGASPSRLSPQQAVKILSLRVPERVPQNAPISAALMNAPGGQAAGAGALQSLIQQLLQAFQPQAGAQSLAGPLQTPAAPAVPGGGGAPRPPRVTPGEQGPQAAALPPPPPGSLTPEPSMTPEMLQMLRAQQMGSQGFTF